MWPRHSHRLKYSTVELIPDFCSYKRVVSDLRSASHPLVLHFVVSSSSSSMGLLAVGNQQMGALPPPTGLECGAVGVQILEEKAECLGRDDKSALDVDFSIAELKIALQGTGYSAPGQEQLRSAMFQQLPVETLK